MAGHRFEIGECVAYLEKRFPNGVRRTELVVVERRAAIPVAPGGRRRPLCPRRKQARPDRIRRGGGPAPRREPSGAGPERQPVVGMS
jgi:hypothetical protein